MKKKNNRAKSVDRRKKIEDEIDIMEVGNRRKTENRPTLIIFSTQCFMESESTPEKYNTKKVATLQEQQPHLLYFFDFINRYSCGFGYNLYGNTH